MTPLHLISSPLPLANSPLQLISCPLALANSTISQNRLSYFDIQIRCLQMFYLFLISDRCSRKMHELFSRSKVVTLAGNDVEHVEDGMLGKFNILFVFLLICQCLNLWKDSFICIYSKEEKKKKKKDKKKKMKPEKASPESGIDISDDSDGELDKINKTVASICDSKNM